MRIRMLVAAGLMGISAASFAVANGEWLKKVPQAERKRLNPFAGQPDAVAAGRNLFLANCAQCHGKNAEGKGSRPNLLSERIRGASDGDIAWLLKNGEVFKGMPRWSGLPEEERWQIIAYIRSLNEQKPEGQQ